MSFSNNLILYCIVLQEVPEDSKWLSDFWDKFEIKPIKFKNKVDFKTTEFKIKKSDKNIALQLIDDVIQNVRNNYFNNSKI